mmetsp:Transcript_34000/g.73580  ORF Transcript_34000/g.73580 Transcript_34000/m.73580 type:complete len:120 (+) Transcript_34000:453-812(+)
MTLHKNFWKIAKRPQYRRKRWSPKANLLSNKRFSPCPISYRQQVLPGWVWGFLLFYYSIEMAWDNEMMLRYAPEFNLVRLEENNERDSILSLVILKSNFKIVSRIASLCQSHTTASQQP